MLVPKSRPRPPRVAPDRSLSCGTSLRRSSKARGRSPSGLAQALGSCRGGGQFHLLLTATQERYGDKLATSVVRRFRTNIVCQHNLDGGTAQFSEHIIRQADRRGRGDHHDRNERCAGPETSQTKTTAKKEVPIVRAGRLAYEFGVFGNTVKVIAFGIGNPALLTWPVTVAIDRLTRLMCEQLVSGDVAARKAYLSSVVDAIIVSENKIRIIGSNDNIRSTFGSNGEPAPREICSGMVPHSE